MADRPAGLVTTIARIAGPGVLWCIVCGAAVALATQTIGTPVSGVAAVQALTPWSVPPLLAVVLIAWRLDLDAIGLTATGIAGLTLALMAPLAIPYAGPTASPTVPPIRLMSTNLLYSNDQIDGVLASIGATAPDVIAFAEITPSLARDLLAGSLADAYPYTVVEAGSAASGMMLWSRFPLSAVGNIESAARSIDAVVHLPFGAVRVVALHPTPPVFDHDSWQRDLRSLDDIAAGSTLPTIVLGDLNASYFHPLFRREVRRARLYDAAASTGTGARFSWPTDEFVPPFVTLDHILLDGQLAPVSTTTLRIPGSDHLAVVADIAPADVSR